MKLRPSNFKIVLLAAFLLGAGFHSTFAGVSKVIQDRYRANYENKALFLKLPIYSERQYVRITGEAFRPDPPLPVAPVFKVGDQVRVLAIDFGGDEIKFKLGAIAGTTVVELSYKFDAPLQENFPNSGVFDRALAAAFTEGLKYTEVEDAKRNFVEQEFERAARDIAANSGTNRDAVLKYVAPRLPAYQEAMREIESLENKAQDLGKQLSQSQSENRKLESDSRSQQAEITKLRTQSAGLQEKIDSSASQLARLGDDLRSAKGVSQNYQRELTNLQRSLKIKVDASRDLASQIGELGQVMLKIQKDNDDLHNDNATLNASLEKEKADNLRLTGENQDLQTSGRQMKETISALTSKEDSLARQYLLLKQNRDNLENITLSVSNLNTRMVDATAEAGTAYEKINAYLGNVLIGSFEWRMPERLNASQEKTVEASFATESIDYVRVNPGERRILQSLGERLKLRVNLVSRVDSMEVTPEKEAATQEIGERDRAVWKWNVRNRGTEDGRLLLQAFLVNKNGDEIPLIQSEQLILSSNLVRQVRNYIQPIPLLLGVVIGSLLMGIAGLFRRGRHAKPAGGASAKEPPGYSERKQL